MPRGHPEEPVQAHHVVDAQGPRAAEHVAQACDRVAVAVAADALGVQRREAPVLAVGEELVGRCAARGARARTSSRSRQVSKPSACTPSGRSRYSAGTRPDGRAPRAARRRATGRRRGSGRPGRRRRSRGSRRARARARSASASRAPRRSRGSGRSRRAPDARGGAPRARRGACTARRTARGRAPRAPAAAGPARRGSRRTRPRRARGPGAGRPARRAASGPRASARAPGSPTRSSVELVPEAAGSPARTGSVVRLRRGTTRAAAVLPTRSACRAGRPSPSSASTSPRSAIPIVRCERTAYSGRKTPQPWSRTGGGATPGRRDHEDVRGDAAASRRRSSW